MSNNIVEQGKPAGWLVEGTFFYLVQQLSRATGKPVANQIPLFTLPVRPMSDEQIDEILDAAYTNAIATGKTNGGMVGETWNLIAARAIEAHIKGATE